MILIVLFIIIIQYCNNKNKIVKNKSINLDTLNTFLLNKKLDSLNREIAFKQYLVINKDIIINSLLDTIKSKNESINKIKKFWKEKEKEFNKSKNLNIIYVNTNTKIHDTLYVDSIDNKHFSNEWVSLTVKKTDSFDLSIKNKFFIWQKDSIVGKKTYNLLYLRNENPYTSVEEMNGVLIKSYESEKEKRIGFGVIAGIGAYPQSGSTIGLSPFLGFGTYYKIKLKK